MRVEGQLALDPQDSDTYVGGESLLCSLLQQFREGDIIRVQADLIRRGQPVPMFQPRPEIVRIH